MLPVARRKVADMKANQFAPRFAQQIGAGRRQRGMLLIEALCAILIFSFGVLGMVGLQTSAASQSGDAKLRSDASELADKYIGQMWVSDRTPATLQAAFNSSPAGAAYTAWLGSAATAGSVLATLPGVSASSNNPVVTFTTLPAGCVAPNCTSQVTIKMYWKAPHEKSADPVHQYIVTAQISAY
jgi:type IV pilus assembly protein PilV